MRFFSFKTIAWEKLRKTCKGKKKSELSQKGNLFNSAKVNHTIYHCVTVMFLFGIPPEFLSWWFCGMPYKHTFCGAHWTNAFFRSIALLLCNTDLTSTTWMDVDKSTYCSDSVFFLYKNSNTLPSFQVMYFQASVSLFLSEFSWRYAYWPYFSVCLRSRRNIWYLWHKLLSAHWCHGGFTPARVVSLVAFLEGILFTLVWISVTLPWRACIVYFAGFWYIPANSSL